MLPGYPAGVAATSPPYPTGEVAIPPCYPAGRCQAVASGEGSAHDLTPLGSADGGRIVAGESGGNGGWRVVVSGTRDSGRGQ